MKEIVDNSRLSAVASCDLQAVLRYVHDHAGREETAPPRAGKDVHASLAAYFRTNGDVAMALQAFDERYRDFAAENVAADDRLSWANVRTIMEEYYRTHPIERFPFAPIQGSEERGVLVPLTEGIDFWAMLDLAGIEKTVGGLYVVDHKTTGRVTEWWRKQFRIGSQLSGYIWAKQQELGDRNAQVVGAFVNAIQLEKLPEPSQKRCRIHKVPYAECWRTHAKWEMLITSRTPLMIEAWRIQAVAFAQRYIELKKAFANLELLPFVPTQGRFNGSCTFCEFRDFCAAERKPELVESMLVKSRWAPWEKEETA